MSHPSHSDIYAFHFFFKVAKNYNSKIRNPHFNYCCDYNTRDHSLFDSNVTLTFFLFKYEGYFYSDEDT